MQSLVMDGVRRTSVSRAMPQAPVFVSPKVRAIREVSPITSSRVGMDGVRRAILTPHEVLDMASLGTSEVLIPQALSPQRSYTRPMIGFAIIASAAIVASITSSHIGNARATNIASTSSKAAASIASPAPVVPKAAAAVAPSQASSLQTALDAFVATHGSAYTIYVKDLKNGTTASVNADRVMRSASLYKLFVAQRIYQMVDNGSLSYSQYAGSTSGSNIENCLTRMINISDNSCGHDLGAKIGWGNQDSTLKNSGYSNTTLGADNAPQMTNAKDVGLLLEHLYGGTLMSPNATNKFMDQLKDQRVNDRLPRGLPAGTVIAHKTGDLQGYTHDAGIIYGKNTDFVVVVMSGPWPSPENSKAAFGALAGQLNTFFNN